jgi:hypothetical protein
MPKYYATRGWYYNPARDMVYEYRCDPVPFIRCRRGSTYGARYYKQPRTIQERRAYFHDEISEYDVRVRITRSARNLPDPWDDRSRADFKIKNWKRYRRTQYKT